MSNTQEGVDQDQSHAFVSQLGVVSDRELSKRFGLSIYYVKVEREARGIPAFSHAYVFPEEAQALLGYELDTVISERFSIPLATVHRHRVALGLPRVKNPPLPAAAISLLGTCPDTQLADQFNVTSYLVSETRKKLGIACFEKPKAQVSKPAISIQNLPAEAISLLGTMSDKKIARRFRVYYKHIASHRTSLGIPAYKITTGKNQTEWSSEQIALLGTIPDQDVADRLGITVKQVCAERHKRGVAFFNSRSRWTQELLALLGTIPDREVAARSNGVFQTAGVRSKRIKEGIALCTISRRHTPAIAWTSDMIALIGTLPDQDIADQIGVSRQQVGVRRREMGMAPIKSLGKWPAELLALLGTITDSEVAARSNGLFRTAVVASKRRKKGIALCAMPKKYTYTTWTADKIALIGTLPDQDVADQIGVPLQQVSSRRQKMGMAPIKSQVNWPSDLLALLGEIPDTEIAARFKGLFGVRRIRAKRKEVGIARCNKVLDLEGKPKLPPEAIALLGTIRDTDIAAQFSIPHALVSRTRMGLGVPRADIKPEENLPAEAIPQLGNYPDVEIAERFGLSVYYIHRARHSLEIPAFVKQKSEPKKRPYKSVSMRPQHTWKPEDLALLGTISDAKMARMTGIPMPTCTYQRIKLGIEPYRASKWTPELTALLGKVPDEEVVTQSKGLFNIRGVRKKRGQLRIAVCPAPKAPKAKSIGGKAALPEVIENLGKISDYEIARRTGVDRASITRQRQSLGIKAGPRGRKPREWTEEEEALLGKFSDRDVGRKLGISHNIVNARRTILKIPAAQGANFWTDSRDALLGTMVDSALAQQFGRSFWEVYERRKMLGIPPFEYAYSRAQQDEMA